MTLFGFVDAAEREAFRLLVTVQGVGAKAAMAILTVLGPDEIAAAVMSGDKAMVARADGVGPKLAQRIVNELASKIGTLPAAGAPSAWRCPPAARPDRWVPTRCRRWSIWDMAVPRRMPRCNAPLRQVRVTTCRH